MPSSNGQAMAGRNARAVRTAGRGRAHHGLAGFAHHGTHVFEVDVHLAVFVDDLGDTAHGIFQHVVGMGKGFFLPNVVTQHVEQLFIEHHDQRIDVGFEFCKAVIGVLHAPATFPFERLGHHADGEDAHLLGDACDHGCGARSRAPAHAGRDEQHVGARNRIADVIHRGFGGVACLLGLAARTQAALAQLDGAVRRAAHQGLCVGVGTDELHALDGARNHVFDGVAAATADPDHLDLGALVEFFGFDHFDGHVVTPGTADGF